MIFLDTETTGLLSATVNDLDNQPRITEIALVKTTDDLEFVDQIETLVNPGTLINEEVTKITGITSEMVKDKPSFPELYMQIAEFFVGETTIVAHNAPFDMGMFWVELARIGREFHFPWPIHWICTVEKTFHIAGCRMKLRDLHYKATGKFHDEKAHRAMEDVYALIRCFRWMKDEGMV